jgi:two-component system invasion response regulator UvrY
MGANFIFLEMIVAIVDSHPVFLSGLSEFLNTYFLDIRILRFESINAFEFEKTEQGPDLVIVGVNMIFKEKDIKRIHSIQRSYPLAKIIIYYDQISMTLPFLKMGADGFVAKNSDLHELTDCIQWVLSGRRYLSNDVFDWIVRVSTAIRDN